MRKKSEFELLLDKYIEKFGQGIPLFLMMGTSEDELMDMMEQAIEKNEKIEADFDESNDY
ncbi:MAG: hypothetical protein WBI17_09805 [Clostridiaceae bacterium]